MQRYVWMHACMMILVATLPLLTRITHAVYKMPGKPHRTEGRKFCCSAPHHKLDMSDDDFCVRSAMCHLEHDHPSSKAVPENGSDLIDKDHKTKRCHPSNSIFLQEVSNVLSHPACCRCLVLGHPNHHHKRLLHQSQNLAKPTNFAQKNIPCPMLATCCVLLARHHPQA